MWLTLGSDGAASAWLAVSTLVVHAYKHAGHGTNFILYVNNTDLLHMCCKPWLTKVDFLGHVQCAA